MHARMQPAIYYHTAMSRALLLLFSIQVAVAAPPKKNAGMRQLLSFHNIPRRLIMVLASKLVLNNCILRVVQNFISILSFECLVGTGGR
jgi:hypothetical protein